MKKVVGERGEGRGQKGSTHTESVFHKFVEAFETTKDIHRALVNHRRVMIAILRIAAFCFDLFPCEGIEVELV